MEVIKKHLIYTFILIFFIASSVMALDFNEDELIILKGNNPELEADEGYLYFPFQSNTELKYILLDHVDSGKSIKFSKISRGEHHALIKLKAGSYYWKRIRKELGFMVYQIKFDKDDHQFEIKPGVVNYVGNWSFNLEFRSNGSAGYNLASTNKFSYEWLHYKNKFSHLVNNKKLEYVGPVNDNFLNKMQSLMIKNQNTNIQSLNLHGLPETSTLLEFYETSDGVEQQTTEFPKLATYVKNNDREIGDMSPSGRYVLMHSNKDSQYIIELLDTKTFTAFVIFKQKMHRNTRISNLNWIDQDSFLYDLDFGDISSTHVVHLGFDDTGKLTSAKQLEFPINGVVVDTLKDVPNALLFANFSEQESVRNDGRGLYKVNTTDEGTLKKSFWKTMEHTRQFDFVVQWLTDSSGTIRSAIEMEYDKKLETIFFHHWFLDKTGGDAEWKKIISYDSDHETPSPVVLSEDETYFFAITNEFGEMNSIHKYSTKDYSYLGPFFEDKNHDITSILTDPDSNKVVAYSYIENGDVKLNYFNENDDRIKFLREQNPTINLYIRQHNKNTGNMLVFGNTNHSKGAWYLYNEHSREISKLMDVNEDYENLPKGDTQVIKVTAEDGVAIEGYLVLPSINDGVSYPLVVIPHGGPIGVRDYASNDEMQHFYAAHGLATLKVNYRGSSGFGKSFESMGNGQWGEKIEADIHQMVQHVVKKYSIDSNKICAMGSSYGGYSALMLTILYPDTYECAVSFAGVMDIPLMFTGITSAVYDEYHELMKKIVGDPAVDLEKMMKKSPFFLAEKIIKPVKMFHGQLDDTVSLEQSLRMVQAFHLLGKDVNLTVFEDEAHNRKYINTIVFHLAESLKFIQKELSLPSTAKSYEPEEDETKEEKTVLDFINQ